MAQTNVQAFSGDVAISSNLAVDTNTLFVDSVGNKVGIGVTNPGAKLHIVTPGTDIILLESSGNPGIKFYNTEGGAGNEKTAYITYKHGNRGDDDEALQFYNESSSGTRRAFTFLTSGTLNRLTILDNGNVGIGTASPTTKFTLYGDDTEDEGGLLMKVVNRVALNNGFTGIGLGGYSQVAKSAIIHERTGLYGTGNLMFCNDGTTDGNDVSNTHARMTITSSGKVGIGTTSPDAELHVAGTGAIVLPGGTTGERPGTGVAGMVRFNATMNKLEFYTGTVWSVIGSVNAIGGTVTNVGGYTVHTFTSSATFTVISGGDVEYLVVAGGGSGATPADSDNRGGGGGGAGGMLTGTLTNLTPDSYTITVGASGSQSGTAYYSVGTNGSDSTFSTVSATGGGRGGAGNGTNPNTGGSGGGGGSGPSPGTGAAASPSGQGFAGGDGTTGAGGASGGGGGGAGGAGANFALGVGTVVSGGIGQASSISGSSVTYSKGGWSSTSGGFIPIDDRTRSGNTGDGGNSGNGLTTDSNIRPSPGSAGIVIIRYLS